MQTPDWNKIAGVAEAAAAYEKYKPTPAESATIKRIMADFMELSTPGKLVVGLIVVLIVDAQAKASVKS